jgi:N-methylhydantoinase B/oxoprolinase/acetone carboxylase alpha subunit
MPCHRVIASSGGMGGYSAGEGVRMKLRLLELEAAEKRAGPRRKTARQAANRGRPVPLAER